MIKNTENQVTKRKQLCQRITMAVRFLAEQKKPTNKSLDALAYILVSLREIEESIEAACVAWEKRDYWLKADKYRMEWRWTGQASEKIEKLLTERNISLVPDVLMTLFQHLNQMGVQVPKRGADKISWDGSYNRWLKMLEKQKKSSKIADSYN